MMRCAGKIVLSNKMLPRRRGQSKSPHDRSYYDTLEAKQQGNAFWKSHWDNRDRLSAQRRRAVTFAPVIPDDDSLYATLVRAGIEIANHESDLYFPVTARTCEILSRFELKRANAKTFKNQAPPNVGELWYDVPFAYVPYWEARRGKHR